MSNDPIQIPYATPEPKRPSKTAAAAALLFGGLGLIFLGGCFLIGVLMTWDPPLIGAGPSSAKDGWMTVVLLVSTLACFAGAVCLIVLGAKGLIKIVFS
jgi:hypothetical protein